MKFLRDKLLRQLGAYLVLLTVFVFLAEYFFIDSRINRVEEAELKIEYTQLAQLNNQKISLQVQHFLHGNRNLGAAIAALIEEQDFHLKTLKAGGRMGQRNAFIQPLSRLPRVTFEGLQENWDTYKKSILFLISEIQDDARPPSVSGDSSSQDIISQNAALVENANTSLVRLQYEGLSMTMAQWYDKLVADLDEEVENRKVALNAWKTGLLVANILVVVGLYSLFLALVLKPLSGIEKNIAEQKQIRGFPGNELGKLATQINHTIENLKDATEFVEAIGKGNLTMDYKEALDPTYAPGKNKLADSLIEMQAKLKALNEEEQKRQWTNEGLTRFVDILRTGHDNLSLLGDRIISGLISYTHSNQGALYILNDDEEADKYLELISIFAWDSKKHEQQRIKPGQGLLGQTFLEKETTYLTSLPEEYIRITSGLGGANPKAVLIVPLKVDQRVYGLVELASFNEFQAHEISFVEKLGDSIASTLANARAAHRNKVLIEQFREQAEEMRAQEEEMRQNMEELQATQEEVVRKEKDYLARIRDLEQQAQRKTGPSNEETERMEEAYRLRIEKLEKELAMKTELAGQWEIAEQLSRELRVHLDAMRITREELNRKSGM